MKTPRRNSTKTAESRRYPTVLLSTCVAQDKLVRWVSQSHCYQNDLIMQREIIPVQILQNAKMAVFFFYFFLSLQDENCAVSIRQIITGE